VIGSTATHHYPLEIQKKWSINSALGLFLFSAFVYADDQYPPLPSIIIEENKGEAPPKERVYMRLSEEIMAGDDGSTCLITDSMVICE
jgi:hypothetical protein